MAELTATLPDDQRGMVEYLVRSLADQRFVVDAGQERPHGLSEAERLTYADEIAFIGYAADSPEWRFERLRRSRLMLIGDGPLLSALLEACVGAGWQDIRVVCPDAVGLQAVAQRARRDPAQAVGSTRRAGISVPRRSRVPTSCFRSAATWMPWWRWAGLATRPASR